VKLLYGLAETDYTVITGEWISPRLSQQAPLANPDTSFNEIALWNARHREEA
jgi:hypothetical protein